MPQLAPIALTVGSGTETYIPASSNGTKTEFVDSSPSMVYDARLLTVTTRPASAGNSGRTSEHLGVRPIPLEQGECCIDVTNPAGNTFRIHTMVRKTSSKAQAEELVDMIKSYVATTEFLKVVTESGFY